MKRLWIGGGGYSGYGGDDPVIPNAPFWVDRMGFQLPDPLTDFRGGGVLSLSMMVFIVEQVSRSFTSCVCIGSLISIIR